MPKLYIPEVDNLGDIDLAYVTLERIVFAEFLNKVSGLIFEAFGESGAADIFNREDHAGLRKNYRSALDPLFLLSSYIEVDESPVRSLLPFNAEIHFRAKRARHNRNLWAHYAPLPKRDDILGAIALLHNFAKDIELPESLLAAKSVLDKLSSISIRRNRLLAGQPIDEPSVATVAENPVDVVTPEPEANTTRPRIGAVWEDSLPSTVFQLNSKYRDILDGNGDSQAWRLGGRAKSVLDRWFRIGAHSWLWVDLNDGATVALIDGDPFLIGYMTESDPVDTSGYRGFIGQELYENDGGKLVDVETRESLESGSFDTTILTPDWVNENVPSGANVQLTDFGDLVLTDAEGPRKIVALPAR